VPAPPPAAARADATPRAPVHARAQVLNDDCALLGKLLDDCLTLEVRCARNVPFRRLSRILGRARRRRRGLLRCPRAPLRALASSSRALRSSAVRAFRARRASARRAASVGAFVRAANHRRRGLAAPPADARAPPRGPPRAQPPR
jgi:hypothetical protein